MCSIDEVVHIKPKQDNWLNEWNDMHIINVPNNDVWIFQGLIDPNLTFCDDSGLKYH